MVTFPQKCPDEAFSVKITGNLGCLKLMKSAFSLKIKLGGFETLCGNPAKYPNDREDVGFQRDVLIQTKMLGFQKENLQLHQSGLHFD